MLDSDVGVSANPSISGGTARLRHAVLQSGQVVAVASPTLAVRNIDYAA